MSKTQAFALALSLCPVSFVEGCKKPDPGAAPQASASGRSAPTRSRASETKKSATPMLTKEEVGAILGVPVTEIEGSGTSLTYKTAEIFMETTIDLEETDDAVESMALQHNVDGAGDAAPGVGDEAFFGILSTLYVRKGNNIFISILPPNLQSQAQAKAVAKINTATAGRMKALADSVTQGKDVQPAPDDLEQASKELREAAKGDPIQAGMKGNDMQGVSGYIKATKHTGTVYETKGRAMAVALANKLLAKL